MSQDFQTVAPGVRALTAPNPGPMTHEGTRTYLLGASEVAVIDPGPENVAHLEAILGAVGTGRLRYILVTHAHRDHSTGVAALKAATGAEVLAFGPAHAGRSPFMQAIAERGDLAGGEGIDTGFLPDRRLTHGEEIASSEWRIEALHTPGHLSSHMCFALSDAGAIFTGDTLMGWSTTVISPPDGSIGAFLGSMEQLGARRESLYLPGHGAPVPDGPKTARAQAMHRRIRESQVLAALAANPRTVDSLVAELYQGLDSALRPAAARNVLAHLLDLSERGLVVLPEGPLTHVEYALSTR